MRQAHALRRNSRLIAALAVLFLLVWWLPTPPALQGIAHYLPMHMAMETFAIVVAMLVFGITWNADRREQTGNAILLACAMLAVGLIDFAHMLSYPGMPDFVTPGGTEKAIDFWLAARLLAALALLGMAALPRFRLASAQAQHGPLVAALLVAALVWWIGLFQQQALPATFIEGQGLTPFKIAAEWLIIGLLLIPAVIFFRQARRGTEHDAASLFTAVALSILSELCFTLYKDVADIFNLLGHVYKVAAYLFIYRAVFVESVRAPYQRLSAAQAALLREQAALREQEEFFRLIAENIGDFIAVLDLEGRRLYNSPSYRRFFDADKELRGSDSFAEIHPDDREHIKHLFRETVRTGIGQQAEYRFVLPDGGTRQMESHGGVIRDSQGRVLRVIVVSRDISERKLAEEAIRQLNCELEQRVAERTAELHALNQSLESFVYSVSHDLKTPLRGVEGYSRLLQEDYARKLDEEGRLFIGNIRAGIARMNELIDDLLAYSRMERRHLDASPLDLNRLLDKVLAERAADIAARGVRIDVDLPPLTVRSDAEGLAVVLRNLLENAIKFSSQSPQPHIEIGTRQDEASVILWIKDNGIGFDMKYHDRIFEIFQRLHRLEDYPGTGIGLALVKKAMQRMGGNVWAESARGTGATFYLEIPK